MHAVAGMHLAQDVYDVHDPEVLGAIRWHTTGHANIDLPGLKKSSTLPI